MVTNPTRRSYVPPKGVRIMSTKKDVQMEIVSLGRHRCVTELSESQLEGRDALPQIAGAVLDP
jgi:hypothetical protein